MKNTQSRHLRLTFLKSEILKSVIPEHFPPTSKILKSVIPAQAGIHKAPGSKHTTIIIEQIKSQRGPGHSIESLTAPRRSASASTSLDSRLRGNDKGLAFSVVGKFFKIPSI
ncbi:hypothetical protein KDD30_23870 (plasmid) [Photobacterium sp. GJ3]|uniref:hypothetical protein n=1 Tax=Photobacterium sp. GJ3 TaxID=2829502 RepID=UPI001B8AB1CC|nr:hypothetical protein [Photobacterium sp. GJ3]QUJ69758.1 hypothetical protein KDD30_23870 [Photobacterium sp. GJ3]